MYFRSKNVLFILTFCTFRFADYKKVNNLPSVEEKALAYCQEVRPFFDPIRYHCDKLELMIDDELWTLTKYRELLFNN